MLAYKGQNEGRVDGLTMSEHNKSYQDKGIPFCATEFNHSAWPLWRGRGLRLMIVVSDYISHDCLWRKARVMLKSAAEGMQFIIVLTITSDCSMVCSINPYCIMVNGLGSSRTTVTHTDTLTMCDML